MPGELLHAAQPRGCMENHLLNGYTHAHGGIVEIVEALFRVPRDTRPNQFRYSVVTSARGGLQLRFEAAQGARRERVADGRW